MAADFRAKSPVVPYTLAVPCPSQIGEKQRAPFAFRGALFALFAVLFCVAPVEAQQLSITALPPPPPGTQSAAVVNADAPVFASPGRRTRRLGTLALGTRVPVEQRVAAPGCSPNWVRIGEGKYVCERHLQFRRDAPGGRPTPHLEAGARLPFDYAFVVSDGARAFARPEDYFYGDYVEALGRGFGIIVAEQTYFDGIPFVRTRRRLWIEADQVRHARGSSFVGRRLENGELIAFARRRNTRIRTGRRGSRSAGRREVLPIERIDGRWVHLKDGSRVQRRDVHLPERQPRPEGVAETDRWLDVDVSEQTLVAYDGDTPVFATLVSTGRRGRHHATPIGVHRIWVKLAYSDMDNLQREDLETNYAIARVPWVQYFAGSNGLHAAFWHDDFGRRRSHGCVNLSPADARWIYDFTRPVIPVGWSAVFPGPSDASSVIQVRP